MGNQVWRTEQLPEERLARTGRNLFPSGLEGMSPTPTPVRRTGSEQAAGLRGVTGSGSIAADNWNVESLTVAAAIATWTLQYTPITGSTDIKVNGVNQVRDIDYTRVDNVVTFVNPTDLFKGLVSGDPWTLTAQYQYTDVVSPDTIGAMFGGYSAALCSGSLNYWGSDGYYDNPSLASNLAYGASNYTGITGIVFGGGAAQTGSLNGTGPGVGHIGYMVAFWLDANGCVSQIDINAGSVSPGPINVPARPGYRLVRIDATGPSRNDVYLSVGEM